MTHPTVSQLRFARTELLRGLAGVSEADGAQRPLPINSIGWIVGHLAWQENRNWLMRAQRRNSAPHLDELVGVGRPASTPPLAEMWSVWRTVTAAADPYLDRLTTDALAQPMIVDGQPQSYRLGSLLLRTTYHYWFHIGEALAIRQLLGHRDLPDFVGDVDGEAPYQPESGSG